MWYCSLKVQVLLFTQRMGELVKPLDCKSGSFRIASSSLASLNNWISLMFLTSSVFHIFSSLALISGTMVISSRNPIYSVLFLILTFFNSVLFIIYFKYWIFTNFIFNSLCRCNSSFIFICFNNVKYKVIRIKRRNETIYINFFYFWFNFHLWGFTIFNVKFISLNLLETPSN